MTKTEAKRRVWKSKRGKQWIVCTLFPDMGNNGMIRESYAMDYWKACQCVRDDRDFLMHMEEDGQEAE